MVLQRFKRHSHTIKGAYKIHYRGNHSKSKYDKDQLISNIKSHKIVNAFNEFLDQATGFSIIRKHSNLVENSLAILQKNQRKLPVLRSAYLNSVEKVVENNKIMNENIQKLKENPVLDVQQITKIYESQFLLEKQEKKAKQELQEMELLLEGCIEDYLCQLRERYVIEDTYIPGAYKRSIWFRIKKTMQSLLGVASLKYAIPGWKPKKFAIKAEEMYINMNKSLFNNEKEKLHEICSEGLISKLLSEYKGAKKLGNVVWKSFGTETRPKLIHVAKARAEMPDGILNIVQATIKVQVKQSLAIYRNNQVVGGNDKVVAPVEYIVLEKWIDKKPQQDWKIKGKIVVDPHLEKKSH